VVWNSIKTLPSCSGMLVLKYSCQNSFFISVYASWATPERLGVDRDVVRDKLFNLFHEKTCIVSCFKNTPKEPSTRSWLGSFSRPATLHVERTFASHFFLTGAKVVTKNVTFHSKRCPNIIGLKRHTIFPTSVPLWTEVVFKKLCVRLNPTPSCGRSIWGLGTWRASDLTRIRNVTVYCQCKTRKNYVARVHLSLNSMALF
jgi:hypothetical protein